MKDKEFIECLDTILNRDTRYNNHWPYNVGYYDGIFLTFDCWNLVKAIDWSNGAIANNWTVGNYAVYNPSAALGDWTGRQIMDHCDKVSTNMSSILPGEFLLYEGDGHAGVYVGDGHVVECTVSWGVNRVILSDISKNGVRSFRDIKQGRWYQHGRLPFVDYEEPQPDPEPEQNMWVALLLTICDAIKNFFANFGRSSKKDGNEENNEESSC